MNTKVVIVLSDAHLLMEEDEGIALFKQLRGAVFLKNNYSRGYTLEKEPDAPVLKGISDVDLAKLYLEE